MEELRSTDALDREILEDARKKAARALKDAEKNAREAEEKWASKLRADLEELERKHAQRIEAKQRELFARLPLDQRRLRAGRTLGLLRAEMDSVLGGIDRARLVGLLTRDLAERAAALPPEGLRISAAGLTRAEAETIVAAAFPGVKPRPELVIAAADHDPTPSPSLVAEGAGVIVRVGIAAIGEALLREKRAELASALLGPEACDD